MLVPMGDALSGVRLKLTRARSQGDLLRAEFNTYLATDPYRPAVDFDRTTRILTIRVIADKTPEPVWGVKIGEMIHSLRSALDHIVWKLFILSTDSPPHARTKHQFPIFETQEGFADHGIRLHLKSIRQDAIALIESEQPFSTGENDRSPLWHLRELSNADKHRTLHLTGTMLCAFNFTFAPLLESMTPIPIEVATKGPIQQDAILWRGHLSGQLPWPFASNEIKGNLTVDVAFDQATPAVGGWLVMDTLEDIQLRVEHIAARLGREIFKITL